jgi:hypothetical protein
MSLIFVSQKNCNGLGNHPPKVEKEGEGSFTHYWQLKYCLLICMLHGKPKASLQIDLHDVESTF